jgi:amino acid transporter
MYGPRNETDQAPIQALRRTLRLRDLVAFNVSAVISVQWWSTAAQFGPASLGLWFVAMLCFFIPSGLAVMELSSRYPSEGGLYQWTRHAFGEGHGFLVGWLYIIANFSLLPSLLLFVAGTAIFIGGNHWLWLRDDPLYQGALALALLWIVTGANILGLERAKWISNITALFVAMTLAILVGASWLSARHFGVATPMGYGMLVPTISDAGALTFFATMTLAFAGLDLGPLMGGEIVNPRRTIPAAMLIAGVIVAAVYVLGTAAILAAIPREQVSIITGLPEAVRSLGARLGVPALGPIAAAVMTIAVIGPLAASITAIARVPFVIGLDGYLPKALGRVHPRWGSPWVSLLVQASICSLILLAAISTSAIQEAYRALVDISVVLIFLQYVYMFLALPVFRTRFGTAQDLLLVPGGWWGIAIVAGLGTAMSVTSILLALIPPVDSTSRALFVGKVLGGAGGLIGFGLGIYWSRRRLAPSMNRP